MAATLPKEIAYSEPRLQPPPGFKDTTVPGIFSPDTPFSHRNNQPGWIAAPGMQGLKVQPATQRLLTPDSLAELMGGPNIQPPPLGQNMLGPPNAYDQNNPLPPPWYPQPPPPRLPLRRRRGKPSWAPTRPRRADRASERAPKGQPRRGIADRGGDTDVVRQLARYCQRAATRRPWRRRIPSMCRPTLGPTANSKVMVADVPVGTVRAITIKNWVATLTLKLRKGVALPKNATAKVGQTSLLGSQHVELAAPPSPSPQLLINGDTIPLQNSSAHPTAEQTLASLAMVLRGGGIPNLEVIANEVDNIVTGRADQIDAFLRKLDTFTAQLNQQRGDITRAIDSTDRLLTYVAHQSDVLDRVLTELPPLIKYFADQRDLFINAIDAAGRFSDVADKTLSALVPT